VPTERPVAATEKGLPVRSRVGEVYGDPRRVDHEVAQLPAVVGKSADDGSQPLGVRLESAVDAVDHDVLCDELRESSKRCSLQHAL
jgi:hypothetical protein